MRLLLFQSLEMTTLKVNELISSTPVSYHKKIASTRVMLKYLILCTNIINSYVNSYLRNKDWFSEPDPYFLVFICTFI